MNPPLRTGSLGAALLNLRWLLGSKGLAAVLSLIYLAIVTRSLGPAGFGHFALVTGIAQTVLAFVSFQSWQIIVRFGTAHLHRHDAPALARLLKSTFLLDVGGAVVGAALAALAIELVGPHFGWTAEARRDAILFCIVVLLAVRWTAIGVLRLYDKFAAGALGDAMLPIVRLAGSIVVVAAEPSIQGFLIAWAVSEIAASLLYSVLAFRAAKNLPWRDGRLSLAALRTENPGIFRFAAATNGSETVSLAARQLPMLMVGYFASPMAAGHYRLAHQLGRALARVSQLFARALLPELMRIHIVAGSAAGFGPMLGRIVRTAAIGGVALMLLMLVIGKPALVLVAGPEFAGAYPLLLLLGTAAVIEVVAVAFEPALLASGRAGVAFRVQATAAAAMIALMLLLIPRLGTIGAASAVLVGSLISTVLLGLAVKRALAAGARDAPEAMQGEPPDRSLEE